MDERDETAVHEAAHAVAATALGISVVEVTIVPEPYECGWFEAAMTGRSRRRVLGRCRHIAAAAHAPDDCALYALAGAVGGWIKGGTFNPSPSDLEAVRRVVAGRHPLAGEDELVSLTAAYTVKTLWRARDLLQRHWKAVTYVEELLLEHETIDGADVLAAFKRFAPAEKRHRVLGTVEREDGTRERRVELLNR